MESIFDAPSTIKTCIRNGLWRRPSQPGYPIIQVGRSSKPNAGCLGVKRASDFLRPPISKIHLFIPSFMPPILQTSDFLRFLEVDDTNRKYIGSANVNIHESRQT